MFSPEQRMMAWLAPLRGFLKQVGGYIRVGRRLSECRVVLIVIQSFQYMLVVRDLRDIYPG